MPVITAIELKAPCFEKATMSAAFVLVPGAVSYAVPVFGAGSIQAANVMAAGGSAVGFGTTLAATAFNLALVSGLGIFGRGLYHFLTATQNKKLSTFGCRLFSKKTSTQPVQSMAGKQESPQAKRSENKENSSAVLTVHSKTDQKISKSM